MTQSIGIAAPSLYHAFGSKAALYREVIRHYQKAGLSAALISQSESSLEATRKMLTFGIAAVTRSQCPAGCMVSSGLLMAGPEHADLAAHLRRERAKLRLALERRIKKDIAAGMLHPSVNAASLARFYTTVLQGASVQAIDGASHAELADVVEMALLRWPGVSPAVARP